jgi:phosphoglycerate dehydrogenase-like enzyme/predicted dehydrogenase
VPADTATSAPIRVAVVGAGPTAVFAHLPALARLRDRGQLLLSVVCDIDDERATRARQQFGFLERGGDAAGALARDDIDAVYVFGSAQLHYQCGLSALRNGKHLFVEKPVAPTYTQAVEMAQLAAQRALIAVGGLNRRFFKALAMARARVGKSGWRHAEVVFHKAELGKRPAFGAATWLGANGIHALDAMLYMMGGPPAELTSIASSGEGSEPAIFSALMRWSDGAHGSFLCNHSAGVRREEYVFHAPGETYTIANAGLTISSNNSSTSFDLPLIGDGFEAEHEAFIQAIRSSAPPRHTLAAIAPSLFVAEMIEAGCSGAVRLPCPPSSFPATASRGSTPQSKRQSILMVPSAELQPVLGRLLPDYGLVSVDDVHAAATARCDVVAAILGRGAAPLPVEVLDKLPQLRVVGVMGLSLARHEPEVLLERGIALLNCTQAYADSVAEFAFALAILARRRGFSSHELMREGGWGIERAAPGMRGAIRRFALRVRPWIRMAGLESVLLRVWRAATVSQPRAAPPVARDLQGANVGLIGWSANARALAQRLINARARVRVFSEHAGAAEIQAFGAIPASLGEVLASDIVSLHRGLTRQTRHGLGAAELAKLRPGAILINVARGALIEPDALLERIRRGDIFACLDTYEQEPLARSHPLRQARNVFLTSHIAGGSPDMHAAAAEEIVAKVSAFLGGEPGAVITSEKLAAMT